MDASRSPQTSHLTVVRGSDEPEFGQPHGRMLDAHKDPARSFIVSPDCVRRNVPGKISLGHLTCPQEWYHKLS